LTSLFCETPVALFASVYTGLDVINKHKAQRPRQLLPPAMASMAQSLSNENGNPPLDTGSLPVYNTDGYRKIRPGKQHVTPLK